MAATELIQRLETFWHEQEAAGAPDTVFTVGQLFTDAENHAMTKVPGQINFSLNLGGTSKAFLEAARDEVYRAAEDIGARRQVRFELGDCVGTDPNPLDIQLRSLLHFAADSLGIASLDMATVGHDAAMFHRAGIPAAMVLVRNAKGSHNADEEMAIDDFIEGTKVLGCAMLAASDDI